MRANAISTVCLTAALCLAGSGCGGGGEATDSDARAASKAPAPGVPISKGGDNSIQTWGEEGSKADRDEATGLVTSYLGARAARDWAAACAFLAGKVRAMQQRLFNASTCAEAMRAYSSRASTRALSAEAEIDVLSFRRGGGYGFLIYRRDDGVFATALDRDDGGWKIISVTPNPIL